MATPRLALDFAPAQPHGGRLGRVLLLAGLAALAAGGWSWGQAWAARGEAGRSLARIDPATATPHKPASPAEQARARAALRVAHGLQVPWAELLGALEAAPADAVALLGVEPSAQKQTVRLTAEARDPQAMLRYVAALQGDVRLSNVILVSHAVQAQAPGHPVRFLVQARWGAHP